MNNYNVTLYSHPKKHTTWRFNVDAKNEKHAYDVAKEKVRGEGYTGLFSKKYHVEFVLTKDEFNGNIIELKAN